MWEICSKGALYLIFLGIEEVFIELGSVKGISQLVASVQGIRNVRNITIFYENVTECIIKSRQSEIKYFLVNVRKVDRNWFVVNALWCVIIGSLILIMNLLKIDLRLQLAILLILMIPLAYLNFRITIFILKLIDRRLR